MTTSGPDFYHDELEPEQIEALLATRVLTPNEVVEGLWHGQAKVRKNAARGARYVTTLPDPGEAMLRIASLDGDEGVRGAIVAAVASGLGDYPIAMPILFDAIMDAGEGIRDTAIQGLEQRLLRGKALAIPYFVAALGDVRGAVAAVSVQLLIKAGGEAAIPALVPLLGHGDSRYRRAAYDILDRLKWAAVHPLIEALLDPAPRELASKLLGGLGVVEDAAKDRLEQIRSESEASGDVKLVAVAARVLGELGRATDVARVAPADVPIPGFFERYLSDGELDAASDGVELGEALHALRDGRPTVRANAAGWLARAAAVHESESAEAKVLGKLGPLVRDPEVVVRVAVVRAVGTFSGPAASDAPDSASGQEATRLLTQALGDPAAQTRQAAVQALGGLGAEALGLALEFVRAADPPIVLRVTDGLRAVAAKHEAGAVQVLADAIRGARELTSLAREVAILALGDLGPLAEEAAPALVHALRDPIEDVRAAAATALGFLGPVLDGDEIVLGDLKRLLSDPVANVRRQAALAAARITGRPIDDRSAKDPIVVPIPRFEDELLEASALRNHLAGVRGEMLVHALRDGRPIVKRNAAQTIIALVDEVSETVDLTGFAQPLALLLRDGDADVRRAAVHALRALGKSALPGAWFLTAALNDPDLEVRDLVIEVLVSLFPEAEPFLVEALRTDTESARAGIFNVWYRLARHGVPALGLALKNASGLIRLNAAWALEMLAKKGADEVLDALEARETDPIGHVRVAAQAAIDAIKGGKPRPPRVYEPDPVAIPGFDDHAIGAEVLAAHLAATAPERMLRALRDGRAFVRENAARALRLMLAPDVGEAAGPEPVHHAADAVDAIDTVDTVDAVDAGEDVASEGSTEASAEPEPRVMPAARPRIDAADARLPLTVASRDSIAAVRQAALEALTEIGADAAATLVHALADKDAQVRAAASRGLATLDDRALPALVDALTGDHAFVKAAILPLFASFAARALGVLGSALDADSPLLRAGALRALRVIGRDHAATLRRTVEQLEKNSDDEVRAQARATLDHLDGKDELPAATPELPLPRAMLDGLLDADAQAVLAGELDVDLLLRAVRDGREVVRANAAGVLGFVGNAPKRAAMSLAILLRDSEAIVRSAAAEALERLGPELAAPVAFWLTVALADPDANVRERMVNLLAATHAVMPEALIEGLRVDADAAWTTILPVFDRLGNAGVPTLAKALANPSGLIRINAAQGLELLAKRGADAVVDALEAKFNDPINQVRTAAARAIDAIKGGKPRPPRVLEPDPIDIAGFYERRLDASSLEGDHPTATPERLARVLRDGRAWVRANAATLLGFSPSAEVVPSLGSLVALARDEAIEVRAAAIDAVGRIAADFDAPRGGFDRLTLAGVLVEALDDRALRVRKTASAALSALGSAAFPALSLGLDTVTERNLAELTALLVALGDDAMNALPDALSPLTPELHLGALLVLRAFPRDGLAPHRAPVEALSDAQDQHVRAAAVTLLDKIDGKDLVPSTLEPTPLPLPEFADALLSRDIIAERADELRFDLLTHAISDGRDVVRANAATGLEVLGTGREVAWPYLVRALRDPSVEVRVRAAQALAVFPPRRDVAFDLVQALDDASPRVVQAAEAGLRAYGEFAIDAFMYALDDAPELVGKTILPMFGALAEKAVDAFILAQRYDSTQVRKNALIGLRLLDKSLAKGARPTVALARRDEDREVRMEALATLDWLDGVEHSMLREPRPLPSEGFATGPIDESELAALTESFDAKILVELLWDGRRAVRENAATAMGLLGRFDPLLAILLKDPVDAVKEAAAKTLLSLGKKSLPAASSLVEALSEDNDLVRTAARDSLIGLGKAALPALIAGLWVPGDLARRTVVPILEKLGKVATPAIIQALEHPSQLVVLNALQTLGRLYAQDPEGTTRAMDKVKALVRHPLPAIIGAAQKCLFRLEGRTPAEFQKDPVPMPIPGFDKGPLALDVLRQGAPNLDTAWMISALADGRPVVRENAARAAGFMQRALKDLLTPLTIALKDGIPEVQVAAAEAFANLRTADDVAVPALTFALRGATERVKRACLVALDAYGPERVAAAITQHLVGREDWMLQTIGKVAARMSEVLVPALARFAQKPDESLIARENAVRVIGDLGQKARGAEAALVSLLPEMEGMLACKAAFALGAVARPSKELIAAMQKRLEVDPRPSLHKEVRSAVKIIKRRLPPGA